MLRACRCEAGSLLSPGGRQRRLRAPAEGRRALCACLLSCRSPSVSELFVSSNKLSALLLPRPPGLLLCGCWRLLVVTGECVCVLGPGGSVCISHRYSQERWGRMGPGEGATGPGCVRGLRPGRREGLTVPLMLNVSCSSSPLPCPPPQASSFRSVKCVKGTWGKRFYLEPWVSSGTVRQVFRSTCQCSSGWP